MPEEFRKSLAKFYIGWFQDCHKSADYCFANNDPIRAKEYLDSAHKYLNIIMENWDAIEYFSVGTRAFMKDETHPREFQGYK